MSRQINLLSYRKKISPYELELRNKIKRVSVWVLSVYSIVLFITLIIAFILNQEIGQIDQQTSSEQQKIKTLSRNESTYLLLKQKLLGIKDILANRPDYTAIFDYFKSLDQSGITIEKLTFGKSGKVSVQTAVSDAAYLDQLISTLLNESGKRFDRIELTSIKAENNGKFILELSINVRSQKDTEKQKTAPI